MRHVKITSCTTQTYLLVANQKANNPALVCKLPSSLNNLHMVMDMATECNPVLLKPPFSGSLNLIVPFYVNPVGL